ncbi:MAG: hypothetical protein H0Z19_08250 [Archaeoglobus sp.]|uniref:hypothetical protein n=1 Tax=Archaeoglobus sp. TaxID=1872626 RepID=UPI001D2AAB07|nr:hypothetical protein [Archaeoglobus sp.]MBO8180453.1 hypothetical protein [Archaeoglobus sp.]
MSGFPITEEIIAKNKKGAEKNPSKLRVKNHKGIWGKIERCGLPEHPGYEDFLLALAFKRESLLVRSDLRVRF